LEESSETSHILKRRRVFEKIEKRLIRFGSGGFILKNRGEERFDIFPLFERFELFGGSIFDRLGEALFVLGRIMLSRASGDKLYHSKNDNTELFFCCDDKNQIIDDVETLFRMIVFDFDYPLFNLFITKGA
jgi:hypothetical protein